MSLSSAIQKIRQVTPVTSHFQPEVTEKAEIIQARNPGNPGNPKKHRCVTCDPDSWDTFVGLVAALETGAAWPSIQGFARKELPGELFMKLREEYQRTEGKPSTIEWIPFYPARCVDCSHVDGCRREERTMWGLMCRHDCPEYMGKGDRDGN